jgi:hypothetical protein
MVAPPIFDTHQEPVVRQEQNDPSNNDNDHDPINAEASGVVTGISQDESAVATKKRKRFSYTVIGS